MIFPVNCSLFTFPCCSGFRGKNRFFDEGSKLGYLEREREPLPSARFEASFHDACFRPLGALACHSNGDWNP
jgi:hypothetical protein